MKVEKLLIKVLQPFLTFMKKGARSLNKKLKISEPLKEPMKIAKLHNTFNSLRIRTILSQRGTRNSMNLLKTMDL